MSRFNDPFSSPMFRRRRPSMSLLSFMLVGACVVGGVFAAGGGCRLYQASDSGQETIKDEARKYLGELYPSWEIEGMSFASTDSDGDGYISGSATVRDPQTKATKQLNIECAAPPLVLHKGCRNQRMQGASSQ